MGDQLPLYPFKLSPSDFAYLYEECKRCYYLKHRENLGRPASLMPGVFGAINSRLQNLLIGKDLRELSPDLPAGTVISQEDFVESAVIPGTNLYLKGKYDLLVRQPDRGYLLIDFKLSQPNEEKIAKYQTQLMTYKFAFENPRYGPAKTIAKMGLIIMYPDQVKLEAGRAWLDFPPKWYEVPMDLDSFLRLMAEVNRLLNGPPPERNPNCPWCRYRENR